jgi:hypothetical protein
MRLRSALCPCETEDFEGLVGFLASEIDLGRLASGVKSKEWKSGPNQGLTDEQSVP